MTLTVYVSESLGALLLRPIPRLPFKRRKAMAKFQQRIEKAWNLREKGWQGDHRRWWIEGQQAIASEGIDPNEECPF